MNDAEEMTDQLLFLRKGKLVEQGSLDEVRTRYAEPKIVIEFEGLEELQRFTETSPWKYNGKGFSRYRLMSHTIEVEMPSVLSMLQMGSSVVRKVERQTASLEEIFMKVAVIE